MATFAIEGARARTYLALEVVPPEDQPHAIGAHFALFVSPLIKIVTAPPCSSVVAAALEPTTISPPRRCRR